MVKPFLSVFTKGARLKNGFSREQQSLNTKGKIYVTDGIIEKRVYPDKIPDGFYIGRSENEKQKLVAATIERCKGKIWITNNTNNKFINKDDTIPEGWVIGFVTKKSKKKSLIISC